MTGISSFLKWLGRKGYEDATCNHCRLWAQFAEKLIPTLAPPPRCVCGVGEGFIAGVPHSDWLHWGHWGVATGTPVFRALIGHRQRARWPDWHWSACLELLGTLALGPWPQASGSRKNGRSRAGWEGRKDGAWTRGLPVPCLERPLIGESLLLTAPGVTLTPAGWLGAHREARHSKWKASLEKEGPTRDMRPLHGPKGPLPCTFIFPFM